jgi:hypothetical protein
MKQLRKGGCRGQFYYCCLSFIVFKASVRRRLGAKAQLEVKASRRLGKWSKATLSRRQRLLEQGSSGGWNRAPTAARGGGGMSRGGSGTSSGSGGASRGSGGASSGSGWLS